MDCLVECWKTLTNMDMCDTVQDAVWQIHVIRQEDILHLGIR
jgi:hypothetical protein